MKTIPVGSPRNKLEVLPVHSEPGSRNRRKLRKRERQNKLKARRA